MSLRKLLPLVLAVIAPLAARGQTISTVAGGGPTNLDPLTSSVGAPVALRQDSVGNTYILDNFTSRVLRIDATGPNAGKLRVFAGNGVNGWNGTNIPAIDAEFSEPTGMCIDSQDNVWIADSDNALVREILVTPVAGKTVGNVYDIVGIQTETDFKYGGDGGPASSAHLHFPDGCSFDSHGNLYIADRGNHAIRVVIGSAQVAPVGVPGPVTAGNIYTFAGSLDGVDGGAAPSPGVAPDNTAARGGALNGPYDVFVGSNDNVYIGLIPQLPLPTPPPPAAFLIRVIPAANGGGLTAGNIYTIAGNAAAGTTGTSTNPNGQVATSVILKTAQGISVNSSGDVIFTDPGNHVVLEVPNPTAPPTGMTAGNIYIIAGNFGQQGNQGNGNPAIQTTSPATKLASPVGTYLAGPGNLYIADSSGNSVRLVDGTPADFTQRLIHQFAGNVHLLYGGDGGPAVNAELNVPAGIATSSTFDLLIADFGSNLVRGIQAPVAGGTIMTVAGQPEFAGYYGDGIPPVGATVTQNAVVNTNNIWIDAAGNRYLADTDNCVVRKISGSPALITTIAGTVPTVPDPIDAPEVSVPVCGNAGAGGPALSAKLGKITGVASDSAGNVYFTDSTNNVVWVLWKTTTASPARTGGNVYVVSTGTTLSSPTGMFVDSFDNVYFADTNRHVIRQISAATGTLSVVAGTDGSAGFSPDGTAATSAQLKNPFGVFVDGAGNVFISDTGNNVIREVPFATGGGKNKGDIYTVVGTGTAGFNGDGIAATTAHINAPEGMAQGPANSLLFADSSNFRVRSVANLTSNPALTVSKASLDFGNQAVLIASPAQTVTLKNTGAATITLNAPQITGANPADFAFTNHCAATLAASATCTIDVTFTPSTTAAKSATLTVSDTVPESRAVNLTGTGVVGIPGASVSPTPLPAFALQAVGTTSATGKDVTVTNNGTAVLNFTGATPFTFTGTNPGDFSQTSTCGATLAVSASCTITVKFTPTAAGSRTASLAIADNAAGSPQLVPVSGTAAVPTADLSGATLSFPDQAINTPSATKTVTLTNNGTVPLTLNPAIAITGDFSETNDCVSPIAASAHCTITVTFTPTVVGARTGTLTISDNASPTGVTTTQTVALSGNGVSATPTITLTGTTSQTVKAGATATYALKLNATGGTPTTTYTVTFACSGAPSKAACTAPASATVVPGTPTPVTITVSTTAASTLVPFSEMNLEGPAAMRFLPLTILSLLLCVAMMLAWLQNPAGRMRFARFAIAACLVLLPIAMGAMLSGCASAGGSGSTPPPTPVPGTPAGTYTITVTSTVNGQASTTPLTLIVQ